jgi:hypothetical protein
MTTELLLEEGDWPSEPLAPASVWTLDAEPALLIELQRLLALSGRSATFETYGYSPVVLSPGGHYSLISWWNPTQLSVATDVDLDWRLREYEGSDHDHLSTDVGDDPAGQACLPVRCRLDHGGCLRAHRSR